MARGKGGRMVGRLLLIGGVAAVGFYGYKKGWFDPIKNWLAGQSGDTTPTNTDPGTTVDPTTIDGGAITLPDLDLSGIGTFLDGIGDWFVDLFKKPEKNSETTQQLAQTAAEVATALIPAAGAGVVGTGAATTAAVASQTAPTVAAGESTAAASASAVGGGAFFRQMNALAAAGPGTQLLALAEAAVPIIIGTSPAVAQAVHQANVNITETLTKWGVYTPDKQTENYTVNGKRYVVSNETGKTYLIGDDGIAVESTLSPSVVRSTGKKTQGKRTVVPASGGQWNGKLWTGGS